MSSTKALTPERMALGISLTMFAILLAACAISLPAQQPASVPANAAQFVGIWTATHTGTRYVILDLHIENGSLAGGIRVCTFTTTGEGEHADMTITDKTLSPNLPVSNLVVSGKTLTFDWKDPDGDENHLNFERTAENSGRLNWRDLPQGTKMPVILLTRLTGKKP